MFGFECVGGRFNEGRHEVQVLLDSQAGIEVFAGHVGDAFGERLRSHRVAVDFKRAVDAASRHVLIGQYSQQRPRFNL